MKNKRLCLLIGLLFSFFFRPLFCAASIGNVLPTTAPRIIYVKWDATGANNGTSWQNAYKELTDALSDAIAGDQIWVTGGTYYPTRGNDRSASFNLKSGVSVYGRFAGTESSPQNRNLISNGITELSGNIGNGSIDTDNSYHVLKGENLTNFVLDNFFISRGYANGSSAADKKGGGLYLSFSGNSVYTIALNTIYAYQCSADTEGGGAYIACTNKAECRTNIDYVAFDNSQANLGGGVFWDVDNAVCSIQSTRAFSNTSKALESGGGMYIRNARKSRFEWVGNVSSIINCQSAVKGGALVLISSDSSTAKFTWKDSSLGTNQSEKGGSAYIESINGSDNNLSFDNCQIDGTTTGNNCEGAAFSNHATSGKSVLQFKKVLSYFSQLKSGLVSSGKGGVVYNTGADGLSGVAFVNCQIIKNRSLVGSGGVIYNEDNEGRISFVNCWIDSTSVAQDGGVAYMNGGHLTIDSCYLSHNEAGRTGGLVFFQANRGQHNLSIKNSGVESVNAANSSVLHTVADGSATMTPYIYKTSFTKTRNSNTTTLNAPLTFQVNGRTAKITDGKVINAIFRDGKGYAGAIVHEANGGLCAMTYTNCLFLKNVGATASIVNKATNTEGVCKTVFQNTLFWENLNMGGGQGRTVVNQNETSPNATPKPQPIFTYCLVPETDCAGLDQSQCNNSIFGQDPLLLDFNNGYFDLLPCSPAINAGNNASVPMDLTQTLDNRASIVGKVPRIWQSVVDIGATEYTGENHQFSKIFDTPNRTLLADKEYQDATGWTHYYNCAEKKLLLSVKNGSDNLGRLADSLKVSVTTTADYGIKSRYLRGADYLTNPNCDKWFVMNRYWKATGARDIGRALDIRFYFTPKDSADLRKAIPFNAYQDMVVYDVTKATAHDTLVRGIGGTFNGRAKDVIGSLTKWQLLSTTNYRTAQYQTAALNGSGSAGVLVPYGTRITEIDTFLCSYDLLKIGGQELPKAGIFTVTLKTTEGCDSIVRVKVNYLEKIYTGFTVIRPDNGFNSGKIFTFIAPGFKFQWSHGDSSFIVEDLKAGIYTVTVTSYERCRDTITYEVKSVLPFQMPNAFTPNGDSLNDFFMPITYGNPKITAFKIYNRAGQMVYDNEAPDKGWDGQTKGQEAGSDVYVYWIELDYGKGHILRGSGEVNLIR